MPEMVSAKAPPPKKKGSKEASAAIVTIRAGL